MTQRIGIIGGSGLYEIEGLRTLRQERIDTPFGEPSDVYSIGELEGKQIVFLPRHGKGHRLLPTEVNNRANIYGFKSLGVQHILSVSAVGSLRKDYKPTDAVIIDQLFDRTNQARAHTFFGDGIVAHIQFADPLCAHLRQLLLQAGAGIDANVHDGGIYINVEGPQFSTLAESETYRQWGMDVIGMTQVSEAKLAREAEICYATLALVTDFDCWYEAETGETVSVEMIMNYIQANTQTAKKILRRVIPQIPEQQDCSCAKALSGSFMTPRELWPQETIDKLEPILKKYAKR
ncbi:MAG: S-methyl-5'-thioadenosine phosphorylase [candidate division KSB1 bacterium]|nr:S-methyl-5'-thioadenosine phosphorylase [candidate division KSB1 bacterium]